eukprot:gene8656-14672_t
MSVLRGRPFRFRLPNDLKVRFQREKEVNPVGPLLTNPKYDVDFHYHYAPKTVSSGIVRTETARYLRDLGIKFGEITNKSPMSGISLFSNYDLQATKEVVDFLNAAGLSNEQVCNMILKRPHILLRPTAFLRKRVQELREELDMTKRDTISLIFKQPNLLNDAVELKDIVVKRFQLKRSFAISDDEFMGMVERDPRFLYYEWKSSTDPIIKFLKSFEFYDSQIKKILTLAPSVLGSSNTTKLESQTDLFLNYIGFTETAFKDSIPEYPHLLVYRQRLLRLKFDIIKEAGRFTWQDVARAPLTLGYSVERIHTRLSFLKYLGKLDDTKYHLSTILAHLEKNYLKWMAQSDQETFDAFKEQEKLTVKKLRNSIRSKIIHTELGLLDD